MSWIKKLSALFRKELPEETPAVSIPTPQIAPPVVEEIQNLHFEEEEEELPHWLSNEDTLRDEGVIYGLSETDPLEKINIIQSIYKKYTAKYLQNKEELNEKIGELNLILEKKDSQLSLIKSKSQETLNKSSNEENTVRVLTGLILSIGMCAGNYFLIKEGISYGFPNESQWISWGVFLTGMFSLYYSTSIIHNEEKITWRKALEEFGMPLAASIFVYVQVIPHMPWYKSLAFLAFIFFIFLISGKLLLGSISKLKSEFTAYKRNVELLSDKTLAKTDWLVEANTLEQEMERIRVEKWKIVSALNETEATITRLNSDKEAVSNLFLSEYNLAKNYKSKLSSGQISKILNK
jgi:hypothetical protein